MQVELLGDGAWILRDLAVAPSLAASRLNESSIPGLIEAVASYETVGVYFDPAHPISTEAIQSFIATMQPTAAALGKRHIVPVCYEMGEDLAEAAGILGLTVDETIDLHTSTDYTCFAIGFCPGFPYLGYLPERLSGIPRKNHPRLRVEPGSVAITGRQAGIYPLPRPGGWSLLGRTPLTLVDVEDRYFPIEAGDLVRFTRISTEEFENLKGERL